MNLTLCNWIYVLKANVLFRQKLGLLEAGTRSAHYAYTTKDDALKAFAKGLYFNSCLSSL